MFVSLPATYLSQAALNRIYCFIFPVAGVQNRLWEGVVLSRAVETEKVPGRDNRGRYRQPVLRQHCPRQAIRWLEDERLQWKSRAGKFLGFRLRALAPDGPAGEGVGG